MANSVYFVNCVANDISVNLNSAIQNVALNEIGPRVVPEKAPVVVFRGRAASFGIGPNPGKDLFGTGLKNLVQINSTQLHGSSFYEVTVPEPGLDYFFYVFANTMVGQKSTGSTNGIVISRVEIKKHKLQ